MVDIVVAIEEAYGRSDYNLSDRRPVSFIPGYYPCSGELRASRRRRYAKAHARPPNASAPKATIRGSGTSKRVSASAAVTVIGWLVLTPLVSPSSLIVGAPGAVAAGIVTLPPTRPVASAVQLAITPGVE